MIGLFGWAHGGHDHLYPDYHPCPAMGGAEALKRGLQEARRRGKRTIIYANGQLREATEFWRTVGRDIAITQRDGTTYQHTYHKYGNIPVYRFDLGCLHAEVISTVRIPTPMMDRDMVNYTCVYGMRYELESRYGPDVAYLLHGRVPEMDDYTHVVGKPDVVMMQSTPPDEATRYLKAAIDFQRANAAFFWHGRFTDSEGFTLAGKDLVAKGFAAGDRFGVAIWNPTHEVAPFTLEVPGYTLESAAEPGRESVEPLAPMAAGSVRLLRWKSNVCQCAGVMLP
jgi:hypothetical protein